MVDFWTKYRQELQTYNNLFLFLQILDVQKNI